MEKLRGGSKRTNKKVLTLRHKYLNDVTSSAYKELNGVRLIDVIHKDMQLERDELEHETSAIVIDVLNALSYLDSSRSYQSNRISISAIKDYIEIFNPVFPADILTRLIIYSDSVYIQLLNKK